MEEVLEKQEGEEKGDKKEECRLGVKKHFTLHCTDIIIL